MEITQVDIDRGIFPDGCEVGQILDTSVNAWNTHVSESPVLTTSKSLTEYALSRN